MNNQEGGKVTTFVDDIKSMMNAWDLSRFIWIKKFGTDEGFAEWFQKRTAITKAERGV